MINKTIKLAAFGIFSLVAGTTTAQVCHNLYPYSDGVVYDNNGHDLRGFISSNKKEVTYRAGKINHLSNGHWGYMQVNKSRVPSINIHPTPSGKKVDLSFSEYIDATLALFDTKDGVKATWWARQCNNKQGPLFYKNVEAPGKIDADIVRYEDFKSEYATKDFTIVEFNDSGYNQRDYDQLLKNYIIMENGTVKNESDYKNIIQFYDNFLTKFTYLEDPLLEKKSFITCFKSNDTKYLAYFNIVNGKLAGNLQLADLQFAKDRDTLVANVMSKLTGKEVYVYGDEIFGMEKTLLNYGHTHPALKMIRRRTTDNEKFNKGK